MTPFQLVSRLTLALLLLLPSPAAASFPPPRDERAVLLRDLKTLVLRRDGRTAGRRTAPVPQMKCLGGRNCELAPEAILCENIGVDYTTSDPLWKCTAELSPSVRLGATDVVCEGFRSPEDPYVLRGSCGLEYTLVDTGAGHAARDTGGSSSWFGARNEPSSRQSSWGWFNWTMALLAVWFLYRIYVRPVARVGASRDDGTGTNQAGMPDVGNGWWGGGGGGGGGRGSWFGNGWGGGGGGGSFFRPNTYFNNNNAYGGAADCHHQPQQPGFWTGMMGGGLIGYLLGRNRGNAAPGYGYGYPATRGYYGGGNPVYTVPHRGGGGGSAFGNSGYSSPPGTPPTVTSTSYGTTRRR